MKRKPGNHTGPWVTTGEWISLEIKRHILETETPGRYGTYGDKDAA